MALICNRNKNNAIFLEKVLEVTKNAISLHSQFGRDTGCKVQKIMRK